MSNFYSYLGKFTGVLFLGVILFLWTTFTTGWVLLHYYDWFIIPLGYKVPTLSLLQFVGISSFMKLFVSKSNSVFIKDEYKDNVMLFAHLILNPFLLLLMGYILKSMI